MVADELREEMGARWRGLLDAPFQRIPLAAELRIGGGRGQGRSRELVEAVEDSLTGLADGLDVQEREREREKHRGVFQRVLFCWKGLLGQEAQLDSERG